MSAHYVLKLCRDGALEHVEGPTHGTDESTARTKAMELALDNIGEAFVVMRSIAKYQAELEMRVRED